MKKYRTIAGVTATVAIVIVISIGTLLSAGCGSFVRDTQKLPEIDTISRFDALLSKDTDFATGLADVLPLRKVPLGKDDIEVRVWRAFTLPTLEGVFLKKVKGQWSGSHIRLKTNPEGHVSSATVQPLTKPKAGWESFWDVLVEKGILALPLTPENECDTAGLDGIIYFVEVNRENTYKNYQYKENVFECRESKQMTEIGEVIGSEFDSGQEQCEIYQWPWFACVTERKYRRTLRN